jgi:small-conductance mechanosensitive channel
VHIPNKTVIDNPVINLTLLGSRRSSLEVHVQYGTDLTAAKQVIQEAAASCETTHVDPPAEALIFAFGDNAVEFKVLFWHDPLILDQYRATDAVAMAIAAAFAEHDITFAFPQRTLWWGHGDGEHEG